MNTDTGKKQESFTLVDGAKETKDSRPLRADQVNNAGLENHFNSSFPSGLTLPGPNIDVYRR